MNLLRAVRAVSGWPGAWRAGLRPRLVLLVLLMLGLTGLFATARAGDELATHSSALAGTNAGTHAAAHTGTNTGSHAGTNAGTNVANAAQVRPTATLSAGHTSGDPVSPGRQTFLTRCALCHGAAGDGRGQMARLLAPPPADLRASTLDDARREDIVRRGGAAVGRSAAMPAWEAELAGDELRQVLTYVAGVARQARGAPQP